MDIIVPADHRVKIKENEKIDKYLDLARELNILWNMRVRVIAIVDGVLGTVLKVFESGMEQLEIGGRIKTIRITAFSDRPEY